MNNRWNLVCLFCPSLTFFSPFLHFSDNKWSAIPRVSPSPLSLHFTHHSLVPQSLIPLSLPPSLPLTLVFLAAQSSSSSSQSHTSSLHHPSLSFAPLIISKLVCHSLCCFTSIPLFSLSCMFVSTFLSVSSFSCEKRRGFFFFKDFVCLLKIPFCFPPHLSLLPCSSALFPVHITVSSEAQSGTDSISIEAPTRPTLLPFPLLLSPLMVFFVFSLGYVLSSVPPSCLTSTPCLYKTVTMLIRWQAGPL